jgi:predicted lactoylglutathione lyase
MPKQFWINLPVKNINASVTFFTSLGFTFNEQHGVSDTSACLLMGEKGVVLMLFNESTFNGFSNRENQQIAYGSEVLLSISADSKEQVDDLAQLAINAGGNTSHKPTTMQGWMYGCIFSDLDGHQWNVLYMDTTQIA